MTDEQTNDAPDVSPNDIANPYGETYSQKQSRQHRQKLLNNEREAQGEAPIGLGAPAEAATPDTKPAYDFPATPHTALSDLRRETGTEHPMNAHARKVNFYTHNTPIQGAELFLSRHTPLQLTKTFPKPDYPDNPDAPGFFESWGLAYDLDSPTKAAYDWATEDSSDADPDYRVSEDDWKAATEGIPAEMTDRLTDATSRGDLFAQAADLRDELKMEHQLGEAGWTGTSARVLANLFDPSSLALAAVSGGAGELAGFANAAAKTSRIARAVHAGAAGAAEGAAMEAVVADQRQLHGLDDVLIAGATGGALGMGIGAVSHDVARLWRASRRPSGHADTGAPTDDEAWQTASGSVAQEAQGDQLRRLMAEAQGRPEANPEYQRIADDMESLGQSKPKAEVDVADAEARLAEVQQRDPLDDLIGGQRRVADDAADDARVSRVRRSADDTAEADSELVSTLRRASSRAESGAQHVTESDSAPDLPDNFRRVMAEDSPEGISPQTEDVYRALMPKRKQPMGLKDARKTKAKIDARIRHAQEDHAHRIQQAEKGAANARAESRRIDGAMAERRAELQRVHDAQTTPVDRSTSTIAANDGGDDLARTDAAGADAVDGQAVEASVLPDNDELPAQFYSVERARYRRARLSLSGRLKGQDRSQTLRGLADRLFADAVGPAKGSGDTATFSAAEEQDRIFTMSTTKVMRRYLPAHKAWAKEQGIRLGRRNSEESRATFGRLVTRYVRTGEADSQHVRDAGEAIAEQQATMLRRLKEAGVEGFDDIAEDPSYMTRSWLAERFVALNRDPEVGPDAIRRVLTKAIVDGNDDIEDETAEAMAEAIFDRFLRKGYGIDTDLNRLMFGRDVPLLEKTLRDAGVDDGVVSRVTRALEDRQSSEQTGTNPRARSRIRMDEGASIDLPNGNTLHVSDLVENDAEHMVARYLRQMAGQVAVARTLRRDGVEGPINVERYVDRALDQARAEGATQGDIDRFQFGFNMVMGRPPTEGMNTGLAQASRFVRGWNFVRLMGQVGFAQIAEFGPLVGQAGFSAVASRVPRIMAMVRRAEDGTIRDELMADIEENIGAYGVERMLHQPRLHLDDWQLEMDGFGPWSRTMMQRADGVIAKAQRGVADYSGMAGQTIVQQRMAATAISQKFLKFALNPSKVNMERMRSIGLGDEMLDRVLGQIRRHHTGEDGVLVGRKLKRLNLDQWDDLEARDAFAGAMHKWSYRMVQRNFVGELPGFMDTELGKMLGQFRSFVAGAWEKQLLVNLNQHDAQAAMTFLASSFFGGLGYVAQTYLNSLGADDPGEYRRRRLSPVEIGKAAFQRGGYASILPGLIDTGLTVPGVVDEPVFAYGRSTGLATQFIEGNPTVDLAESIGQTAHSTASLWRDDRAYSQKDFDAMYSLMAFQNAQLFRQVGDMVSQGLPRYPIEQPRTIDDYFDGE